MFAVTGYVGRPGMGQDSTGNGGTEPVAATGPFANIASAFGSFGILEWGIIIGGALLLFSVFYTGSKGYSAVSTSRRKRRAKASRRAKLEQQLRDL